MVNNVTNNKMELEKLVEDVSLIGKNGIPSMTIIFDPQQVEHTFVKLYGHKNNGAMLNGILHFLKSELARNNFSAKQKNSILETFEESCEKHMKDGWFSVPDNTIKVDRTGDWSFNPLTKTILDDVKKQTEELGRIGFCTVTMINASNVEYYSYSAGDSLKNLVILGLCVNDLFRVLHVSETDVQKFYAQVCGME